jgi:hypothetical protein
MLLTLLLVPFFGIFLVLAGIFNNPRSFTTRLSALPVEKTRAMTNHD